MSYGPTAAQLADMFGEHQKHCGRCRCVDVARPATLADACLEGARLFKDLAAAAHGELLADQRRQVRRAPRPQDPRDELGRGLTPSERPR